MKCKLSNTCTQASGVKKSFDSAIPRRKPIRLQLRREFALVSHKKKADVHNSEFQTEVEFPHFLQHPKMSSLVYASMGWTKVRSLVAYENENGRILMVQEFFVSEQEHQLQWSPSNYKGIAWDFHELPTESHETLTGFQKISKARKSKAQAGLTLYSIENIIKILKLKVRSGLGLVFSWPSKQKDGEAASFKLQLCSSKDSFRFVSLDNFQNTRIIVGYQRACSSLVRVFFACV